MSNLTLLDALITYGWIVIVLTACIGALFYFHVIHLGNNADIQKQALAKYYNCTLNGYDECLVIKDGLLNKSYYVRKSDTWNDSSYYLVEES